MADFSSEKLKREIKDIFDAFAAIQKEEQAFLAAGDLQGIASWRERRGRFFEQLQHALNRLAENREVSADPGFGQELAARMQVLLQGENGLRKDAARQAELLGRQLGGIRKGRKALQGYSPKEATRSPRFLNSRS